MKNQIAAGFLSLFTFVLIVSSCGPSTGDRDKAKTDSTVVDSVPASGENQFQQDVVPQTLPSQLDSAVDSVERR